MRIGGLRRTLVPVSVILALVFSIAFTSTPVLASAVISYPGHPSQPQNIFDVFQGQTFTLRHRLAWNDAANPGFYLVALYWDYFADNAYHFTLESVVTYFDNNGDNLPDAGVALIDNTVSTQDNGTRRSIAVANALGNDNDGTFNVDITLRVAGPDGTLHSPTDNHPIYYTIIQTLEAFPPAAAVPDPVTVRVLGRGVTVAISPGYQSGLPEATLSYSVTVTNTGDIEDNYDLTVSDNAGWEATLSDNLVDNRLENVQPGENRTATLSVTIPENVVPYTEDNITVTATSQGDPNVSDFDTCIAHAEIARGVKLSISPTYQENLQGGTLSYAVTVFNIGNVEDTYALENTDNEGWTLTLDNALLTIPSWENRMTTLSVTIPENAIPSTEDNITVTATSTENAEVSAENSGIAHVKVLRGVSVSISPSENSGRPGETLNYTVTVTNTGNVADSYDLTKSDNAVPSWNPTVSPTPLTIAAGGSDTATLNVTIPENVVAYTEDNITVTATSTENAEVSAENSGIAHAARRGVKVSISPSYQENQPGGTLIYNVIVQNTGLLDDNYILSVTDNVGWGPIVSPTSLVVLAGENGLATLDVTVPLIVAPSTVDNIHVTATSQEDNTISASDTCLARAVIFKAENTAVIYPTADVYAFGEYQTGYSRSQLKFDLGSIPSDSTILSAKLWLYRLATENWDGGIVFNRVDNQVWEETITASEFDAQTLTNEENQTSKFMSHGWDYLGVLNQLDVDYEAAHTYASFRLRWANDNGGEPSVGIDDGRFLVINSESDELSIVFSSSEYNGIDPYLEVIYTPPYAVSASISPNYRSGLPGEELSYTVTILNTGNLDDNYVLAVSDNTGWGPTISPTSLAVASGSLGEATLNVTVPENAAPSTKDNLIVSVTSTSDPTVSASSSCLAQRIKAEFSLVTLYKVSIDLDTYIVDNLRLVVKFYTYSDAYQAESTIWSGATPAHVVLFENVLHPENKPVENATLVLTTDDTENVIATVATFIVTRDILVGRLVNIYVLEWPFASIPERDVLASEIVDIYMQWPFAPF